MRTSKNDFYSVSYTSQRFEKCNTENKKPKTEPIYLLWLCRFKKKTNKVRFCKIYNEGLGQSSV